MSKNELIEAADVLLEKADALQEYLVSVAGLGGSLIGEYVAAKARYIAAKQLTDKEKPA